MDACPLCRLPTLVKDKDSFICMNCGWMRVGTVELPSDPEMMGDNEE